jgi:hypothetical protein
VKSGFALRMSPQTVDLVLCVRCLLVRDHRVGELYVKGAAPEKADGVFTGGTRDTRLSLGKTDHTATVWLDHASLLVPPYVSLSGALHRVRSNYSQLA